MAERKHFDPDPIVRSRRGKGDAFSEIVERRISRRDVLKGGAAAGFALTGLAGLTSLGCAKTAPKAGLAFKGIQGSMEDRIIVPENYISDVVIRWGDPLTANAPAYNPAKLTAAAQKVQFGYNCDFVGYLPLPAPDSKTSDHGLLGVNHEYVNPELMFPGEHKDGWSKDEVDVMLEAVGFAVVEVKRDANGRWTSVRDSLFNKRYTMNTPFEITGPARGNRFMKTKADPAGTMIYGTMANCAAGKTPWGTVLSGEENFQGYFGNSSAVTDPALVPGNKRYGIANKAQHNWDRYYDRFDCGKDPNECHRFGWVVEIDPYDPTWTPKKRTALGRCRHEAATTHVTKSGKVVMYTGDDARFEYVYKFVSAKSYNPSDRKANRDLMDEGVLYVAKFNDDGSGEWLRLVHGEGPLTSANGFNDQGDVVVNVRIAADLLGATKMDRPEDIEVNPVNEKVYVVCTNNIERGREGKAGQDAMNPRNENRHGHIIEMIEAGNDHAAETFAWEMFLVCGDPKDPSTYYAGFPKDSVSPVSCPDNIAFDNDGNLWIATDGMDNALKINDGVFAVPTEGPERGKLTQFMSSVPGAEVCGPDMTPDNTTLFLAIQHPGEGGEGGKPTSFWPDGKDMPRPSVIAIRARDGGVIGSAGGSEALARRDLFSSIADALG